MFEIAELAREVVAVVAPVLPQLVEEGREVTEELSQEYGYTVRKKARRLWCMLHPHLERRPGACEVIDHLSNAPEDEDAHAALRFQVRKVLAEDSDLADQVRQEAAKETSETER